MQKRSWFKQVFGKTKPSKELYDKMYELISTTNSTFVPFDGNLFNNDIVRSAIRPKANAIGKLDAKHIVGYDENMKVDGNKKIKEILKRPNPYMSMQDFLMKMVYQRELNHNAFAYVKRDELGRVEELYPIPFSRVELVEGQGEIFCKFQFLMGKNMTVPYEDLIHLRKDFYSNDFFGESGIKALENIMNVIVSTDQSIVSAVKNSAVIKWIMKFHNVLRQEDIKLSVDEFIKNYLKVTETGGAVAQDGKYDLVQVKQDNFVPNHKQMEDAIKRLYSYFGTNEKIVQNLYDEDEWLAYYEQELEPIIKQLSEAFTRVFFTKRELEYGNRIIFSGSDLAFASMKHKLGLVAMVDRGAMTPNEWRAILNLAPIEGGNKPIRRLDTAEVNTEVA